MTSNDPWWVTSPPPSPHPSPPDGHDLGLGHILGQMSAEGRRHTELLLGMQHRLETLPDRISDRLSPLIHHAPPAPPSAPPGPTRLQQITDLLKAALPLALLATIVAGKITVLEGVSVLRAAFGGVP